MAFCFQLYGVDASLSALQIISSKFRYSASAGARSAICSPSYEARQLLSGPVRPVQDYTAEHLDPEQRESPQMFGPKNAEARAASHDRCPALGRTGRFL
jgi:hypothetical protein